MKMPSRCPLCGNPANWQIIVQGGRYRIKCDVCGTFSVAHGITFEDIEREVEPRNRRYLLSAFTRNASLKGGEAAFQTFEDVKRILTDPTLEKSILDQLDIMLLYLERKTYLALNRYVQIDGDKDYPVAYCRPGELVNLLGLMANAGYVEPESWSKHRPRLTHEGLKRAAELRTTTGRGNQCFVAMWFDSSMNVPYEEGIDPAIREAGYEPLRIDRKDHNNKIDDEIIAEIRRSALVVADFTGDRGGVYYEAGFASGLGIPVIWMCKNEQAWIDRLHFDTRQYNHILWNDPQDLRKQLFDRIRATVPLFKR